MEDAGVSVILDVAWEWQDKHNLGSGTWLGKKMINGGLSDRGKHEQCDSRDLVNILVIIIICSSHELDGKGGIGGRSR
jgi:hypothetical protein